MEDNEEAMKNGVEFEHIEYEWAFGVFNSRYQEPAGAPITRIDKQLNELGTVIYIELGVGARKPEGGWGWLGGKRRELKILGRVRSNREMFGRKLHTVIGRHCRTMEFITQLKLGGAEAFQDMLGK